MHPEIPKLEAKLREFEAASLIAMNAGYSELANKIRIMIPQCHAKLLEAKYYDSFNPVNKSRISHSCTSRA